MIFLWPREPAVLRSAVTSGPDGVPGSTSLQQEDTTGYWPTAASRARWQTTPPRPRRVNTRHCTKIELYHKNSDWKLIHFIKEARVPGENQHRHTQPSYWEVTVPLHHRGYSEQKQNLKPLTKLHTIASVSINTLFTLLFSVSLLFFRLAVLYRNFCWGTRSSYEVNDAPCLLHVFTHWPQLDKTPIRLVYVLFNRPWAAEQSGRSVRCEYSIIMAPLLGSRMKHKNWKKQMAWDL